MYSYIYMKYHGAKNIIRTLAIVATVAAPFIGFQFLMSGCCGANTATVQTANSRVLLTVGIPAFLWISFAIVKLLDEQEAPKKRLSKKTSKKK